MATDLTPSRHLDGLREAMLAFTRYADRAGPAAAVPSCPGWTVRDLLAHQGMVHRWAAAALRGERADPDAVEREGRRCIDPVEWLADGSIELAKSWTAAPDDVATIVFLNDAPAAKPFWARRQCHETTIHAVDALAASLGRAPRAEETWISADVARDGIDELLAGFLTRRRSRLRTPEPTTLVVDPDDTSDWWLLRLGADPAVTTRHTGAVSVEADHVLTGGSVELYLQLWNRGHQPVTAGGWSERAQVSWS